VLSAVDVLLLFVVLCEVAIEVSHWLMQLEPRFLHITQMTSDGEVKMHLTFLRLHSRQLCVPFLTLLCFTELWASILASTLKPRAHRRDILSSARRMRAACAIQRNLHCSYSLTSTCLVSSDSQYRDSVVLTKRGPVGRNSEREKEECARVCVRLVALS
jgi:hypothetical protein